MILDWIISKYPGSVLDIIDFEDSQMAPREFDILNFLTRLEYTSYFPHPKGTYPQISREFLDGYGMQVTCTPGNNFFYLLIKLDMLETYYRRRKENAIPSRQKSIYSYFEKEGLKRILKWLEKDNSNT